MSSVPELIAISDRAVKVGHYPVTDTNGTLLAMIERRPGSRSFTARAADGSTWCSGTARRLRRCYEVLDEAGRAMITFRNPAIGLRHKTATLADGRELDMSVQLRNGTWTVADGGQTVLTIERANGRLHTDDVIIRPVQPDWDLRLVIALVYGHLCDSHRTTVWDLVSNT